MDLSQEIELLNKVYNTLSLITTKGQETLYMANCLNALNEICFNLDSKNGEMKTVTIPIDKIEEE